MTTKIGFIGTGIMGSRMAANLIRAGYDLRVHNRTQDKTNDLVAMGATWAETPAAAVANADYVITMLAHPRAVEAATLDDEGGFLDAMKAGSVWIDSSTVNPDFARKMAREATLRGIHFLDAPVAGSKQPAQDGNLIFFVGGPTDVVEECGEVFDAMGKAVNHVGEHGMGNGLKIVVNYLLATSMLAFAEGLALGESLGLSQQRLLDTLVGSAVAPPYLAGKRAKIENRDFEAEFPLQWMRKDLEMVAETAYRAGVAMPSANNAKEIYQLAAQFGYGEQDFSAIYEFLK